MDEDIKNNLIYGNMECENFNIYSLGSRTMIIFEKGKNLRERYNKLYASINGVHVNLIYRRDIGLKFIN